MKRLLTAMLIAVAALAMLSNAEARRLGGGGSFGRQSSYSRSNSSTPMPSRSPGQYQSQPQNQPNNYAPQPAGAQGGAIAPRPASPWRGIVGGALAGLGLGALMSHFGMGGMGGAGGGMLSSLLMFAVIAFGIMFLFRMLNRKNGPQPANEPYYARGNDASSSYTPEIGSQIPGAGQSSPSPFQPSGPSSLNAGGFGAGATAQAPADMNAMPLGIPADFDVAGFVRNAKSYFIRLQAAGDKGDIHDLREFTSPEMFAELRLQLQERGTSPNVTDVVQLNGELLGIERISDEYLATVRFNGLIKEAPEASAEPFVELWNFSKPVDGPGGWVLAGIQQTP